MDIKLFKSPTYLEISRFEKDTYLDVERQPEPSFLLGFKHRFVSLFEAMQATFIKRVIHCDTRFMVCRGCGLPQYMRQGAKTCKRGCKKLFKQNVENGLYFGKVSNIASTKP